ncbi:MAG TPA: SRPBCC domain-containing protein [Herpetosiphonaceae bacterium]
MNYNLRLDRVYDHPSQYLWQALTDRELLAQWLMENTFEPQVGHAFQFRARPSFAFDGIVHCTVLEIDPRRRLVYTWQGNHMPQPTTVTWTLTDLPQGTHLRLEQTGFKGIRGWIIRLILKQGWQDLIGRALPEVLSQLHSRDRSRRASSQQWTNP